MIALLSIISGAAVAGFQPNGGFSGSGVVPMTVENVKQMKDDTNVVLQGNIIQKIKHEKYLFQDATGSIVVEIDNDDWNGLVVTEKDKVEIVGEVDKDFWRKDAKIDVDQIRK